METNKTKTVEACTHCGTVSDPVTFFETLMPPPIGQFAVFRGVPSGWTVSLNEDGDLELACSDACAVSLSEASFKRIENHPNIDKINAAWGMVTGGKFNN